MEADEAKAILKGVCEHFTGDIVCLNYEMIRPNDAFGKVMLLNLEV
jgi:hypothetical protein